MLLTESVAAPRANDQRAAGADDGELRSAVIQGSAGRSNQNTAGHGQGFAGANREQIAGGGGGIAGFAERAYGHIPIEREIIAGGRRRRTHAQAAGRAADDVEVDRLGGV